MLSRADKKGLALIAGVGAVLVGILAAKAALEQRPKPGTDNCLGPVQASTVIVVDYTEGISQQTKDEITARALSQVMHNVKVGERVSIFSISDDSRLALKPLVSMCRPPEDGSRVVENVALIRKHFHQKFETPIRQVLSNAPSEAKESPIAQVLTDLSLSAYLRTPNNTLIVFSDMLENTSAFSLYKCDTPSAVVERYRASRRGALERPHFKNTSIKLNLVPRMNLTSGSLQCRDKLWPWFFGDDSGEGASLSVDYLPGGWTSISKDAKR
jgi:hypothetical protein